MHDAELDTPTDEVLRMEVVRWEKLKAEMRFPVQCLILAEIQHLSCWVVEVYFLVFLQPHPSHYRKPVGNYLYLISGAVTQGARE